MTTLYYTKSNNGNAQYYRIDLQVAQDLHTKVYGSRQYLMALLSCKDDTARRQLDDKMADKWYGRLKDNSTYLLTTDNIGYNSQLWIYTVSENDTARFSDWVEHYTTTILPLYPADTHDALEVAHAQQSRTRMIDYTTTYDELAGYIAAEEIRPVWISPQDRLKAKWDEEIYSTQLEEHTLQHESRDKIARDYLLTRLEQDYPVGTLQAAIKWSKQTTTRRYGARLQVLDLGDTNASVLAVALVNNDTITSTVLEHTDIVDNTYYEGLHELLLNRQPAEYTNGHRDIVVKVRGD